MPARPGTTQIGFVGLGIMGAPMALNLIEAGFSLKVYNRTDRPRVQEVVDAGGERVATPAETASGSDVIITNVTDTPDVVEVILGEDGVLRSAREGATVIDMSTISPRVTRDIAAALNERGVHMLDAPVSGGDVGAQQGTLSIMVGGEQSVFDDCLAVFEAMGKNITLVGGNGDGQTCKVANQIIVALTIEAVGEALLFSSKAGADPARVREALMGGFASSRILEVHGERMIKRTFNPGFRIRHQQKDLNNALITGKELGVPLPVTALVQQMIGSLMNAGKAESDHSAIANFIEDMAGTTIAGD